MKASLGISMTSIHQPPPYAGTCFEHFPGVNIAGINLPLPYITSDEPKRLALGNKRSSESEGPLIFPTPVHAWIYCKSIKDATRWLRPLPSKQKIPVLTLIVDELAHEETARFVPRRARRDVRYRHVSGS
ncbi:hypothetical protein EVAR_24257_1 [Eumeta japonica]|uniref:Uncharacterized protein n=1 Tax=Eumeta variegata TaxID=151549 RepID=A0A4C1VE69_EUMVA|nr:hypothetical protein EVAR_24257_1 [Eumeta japonica]